MTTTRSDNCPELEQLFTELAEGKGPALVHAESCDACKAVLEEHRQLEKDLYRLADPLPPPDLVHKVMAQIAAEPKPVASEVRVGAFILVAAVLFAFVGFAGAGVNLGSMGAAAADFIISAKSFFAAAGRSAFSVWQTAGPTLTFGSLLLLFVSLFGLRKLASSSEQPA